MSRIDDSKQQEIQAVQSRYRRALAASWQIPVGARILELGCGQGDMTAILAETAGHVTAVDIAPPTYGAPQTLAEATNLIKASPLGPRIDFRFEFDVLDPSNAFQADTFDYVVLAHSSWYFSSSEQLGATFGAIRPWAKHLCFAEWDLELTSLEQVPHLLAVLIQGQAEAFRADSWANVRTPLHKSLVRKLLEESGWQPHPAASVDTSGLQDADWEIALCNRSDLGERLPSKFETFLETEIELLRQLALPSGNRPLFGYSLIADRS